MAAVRKLAITVGHDVYEQQDLQAALGKGFTGPDSQVREAIAAYALGRLGDAEEALAKVKDAYGKGLMGLICVAAGEQADAVTAFRAAAKDLPDARIELARVLLAMDKAQEAQDCLADAPSGAEQDVVSGLINDHQGLLEKAIRSFETALEANPEHTEAAFQLGVLLDRIGDEDMAIEHYLVCADVTPHFLGGVINLGILYDERGEANAAIDCFRQVLAHNPRDPRALMLLRDSQASRNMFYDEKEEREREKMEKILKTSVNDFELSVRSRNCLAKMNIFTLGDLISITEPEMLNYKNFGDTSLREVKEMLDARGLRLGMLRDRDDRSLTKADQKTLSDSFDKLELSSCTMRLLERLGCHKIGDIIQYTDLEFYRMEGSGQSVVQEISTALGSVGLRLKMPEIGR